MVPGVSRAVFKGTHIRLEPLGYEHVAGLTAASAEGGSLYQWSTVPRGDREVRRYVEAALAAREAGIALPFATVRQLDGRVIGSTRFWNLETWPWPATHPRHGRSDPDTCEIGYTWLDRAAIRTPANTEAKLLMLTHAFEIWCVLGVAFHTDARNERSRAALERIGARREGILRAHRLGADNTARDSVRYSIIRDEWPQVHHGLCRLMSRGAPGP